MAWLLKRIAARVSAPTPISTADLASAVGDLAASMTVRVSAKASRISLRVNVGDGTIELVQPRRVSARAVLAFAASHKDWIAKHLALLPARVEFVTGALIPFRGRDYVLQVAPETRGGVRMADDHIVIAGRAEHTRRRLIDWLKAEAKKTIAPLAHAHAEKLGRKVARVTVRDTTSRWGSCSPDGRLSFSWRLILAPDHVLTYVIAHEVAHLRHMNHGPAFWRTVHQLLESEAAGDLARDWLRRNGAVLHRYG
jgi:predicted metal-dependent hydrolase